MLHLDLASGTLKTIRYWDVPVPNGLRPRSDAEWEEAIDHKLRECVRRQLVSDVPLGAFLSGGVDSSLIVHGMGSARTFSIGFDDPTYNESAWADRVAKHLGVSHRVEILEPDVGDLFQRLMYFMDDPIGDFSIFLPTRRRQATSLFGGGGRKCRVGWAGVGPAFAPPPEIAKHPANAGS